MASFLDEGSCAKTKQNILEYISAPPRKETVYSYHKNIGISMASVGIHSRYEMLTIAIATAVKMIKVSQQDSIVVSRYPYKGPNSE